MAYNDFVRRSQLIVPFGVGAIIDFPEDTLMTAALDLWPYERSIDPRQKEEILEATKIVDSRLQKRLSKIYNRRIDFFLTPTEGKKQSSQKGAHLQPMSFVRFPTFLTCPRCKVLKRYNIGLKETPKCDSDKRLKEGKQKLCRT